MSVIWENVSQNRYKVGRQEGSLIIPSENLEARLHEAERLIGKDVTRVSGILSPERHEGYEAYFKLPNQTVYEYAVVCPQRSSSISREDMQNIYKDFTSAIRTNGNFEIPDVIARRTSEGEDLSSVNEAFRNYGLDPTAHTYVIEDNDLVAGAVELIPSRHLTEMTIAVNPKHQKGNIGPLLTALAAYIARGNDWTLWADCTPQVPLARAFGKSRYIKVSENEGNYSFEKSKSPEFNWEVTGIHRSQIQMNTNSLSAYLAHEGISFDSQGYLDMVVAQVV